MNESARKDIKAALEVLGFGRLRSSETARTVPASSFYETLDGVVDIIYDIYGLDVFCAHEHSREADTECGYFADCAEVATACQLVSILDSCLPPSEARDYEAAALGSPGWNAVVALAKALLDLMHRNDRGI